MPGPSQPRLRQTLDRGDLITRYQALLKRLEAFLIASSRRDRARHGTLAVSRGALFQERLRELRLWVEKFFSPFELRGLRDPDLIAILDELIDFHGAAQLLLQSPLPANSDVRRIISLLAGPQILETWARATGNVVRRIDAEDKIVVDVTKASTKYFDGYALALAQWIIDLPFDMSLYQKVVMRSGLSYRRTEAVPAIRALRAERRRLEQWRDARDGGARYDALKMVRLHPRDARFLPLLDSKDFVQLTDIAQRAEFYLWAYELFVELGHEVRWPLSAYIVATGAGKIANAPVEVLEIDNRLQAFMRIGNQVIFDDVLPKLSDLFKQGLLDGPRTDAAAVTWDAETLADEQHLIQPLYITGRPDSVAVEQTLENLFRIARKGGAPGGAAYLSDVDRVEGGPYHRSDEVPKFPGSFEQFKTPRGRWDYGILLGRQFSTLDVQAPSPRFPDVGPEYRDGTRFRELDVRPNLHLLDAILDDTDPNASEVADVLNTLSAREREELRADPNRQAQLRNLQDPAIDEFLDRLEASED